MGHFEIICLCNLHKLVLVMFSLMLMTLQSKWEVIVKVTSHHSLSSGVSLFHGPNSSTFCLISIDLYVLLCVCRWKPQNEEIREEEGEEQRKGGGRGGWEKHGNDSIRCRISLGHMAPLELTGERYISHWATRFGKDSNPGRQHRRPKT